MERRGAVLLIAVILGAAAFALGLGFVPEFAYAGDVPPRGAPIPLIGLGLPIAGAVVATVLVARRFRRKQ
jgi:hypothetical protein